MRPNHGIMGLPGYQGGGGLDPSRGAKEALRHLEKIAPWLARIAMYRSRVLKDLKGGIASHQSPTTTMDLIQAELAASDDLAFKILEDAVPLEAREKVGNLLADAFEKAQLERGTIVPLSHGLGSLPQEPSWTRAFGIPERGGGVHSLSAKQIAELTPQEQVDRMLLQEFDRLAPVRAAILETPRRGVVAGWGARQSRHRAGDVRERFAIRNPDAPIGWELGAETVGDVHPPGQRPVPIPPEKRLGSYESYFPDMESSKAESMLLDVMGPDITTEEIALALDDPMFGGAISGNAPIPEIDERVYARRYANLRMGTPGGAAREQVAREALRASSIPAPDYNVDDRTLALARSSERDALERAVMNLPGGSPDVDPPLRSGISKLKSRVLRAAYHRLPAIALAAGATAVNPLVALAQGVGDVMFSPEQMGSGDLPKYLTEEERRRLTEYSQQLIGDQGSEPWHSQPSDFFGDTWRGRVRSGMETRGVREARQRRGYARGGAVMNSGIASFPANL